MFLIIQTGEPVTLAQQKYGTFAQWFIDGLGRAQAKVIDVHRDMKLPNTDQAADELTGIIITGSAAMVTDHDPWLVKTQHWLAQMGQHSIPTFGVCFGHQVLADMLGGRVDYNPKGRNMGISQFKLHNNAKSDPLLNHLPSQIPTFASHLQIVTELPECATLLGSCNLDVSHAFSAEGTIWGLQFHPEWNQQIMQAYIQARHTVLIEEGFKPTQMQAYLEPCHAAYDLLFRFSQLAKARRKGCLPD